MTPLFSTLLGACIGSFLNVCLYRWKGGGQVFSPPSFCPHCKKNISWYDNIPVLSFVFLRAKCRFCHRSISWQYPIVEGVTAGLFGLSFFYFHNELQLLIASFFFVSFMTLLVASDLKWRLLPHPFNNLFILTGLAFPNYQSSFSPANLFVAANGFILTGALLYGVTQIFKKGLGGGDIKLAAGLAIWLGFSKSIFVLLFAFGVGALVVLPLLKMKKVTKKSMIPFGPFLAMGALLVWFWPGLMNRLGMGL